MSRAARAKQPYIRELFPLVTSRDTTWSFSEESLSKYEGPMLPLQILPASPRPA